MLNCLAVWNSGLVVLGAIFSACVGWRSNFGWFRLVGLLSVYLGLLFGVVKFYASFGCRDSTMAIMIAIVGGVLVTAAFCKRLWVYFSGA